MPDENSQFDFPEEPTEKEGFPWLGVLVVVGILAVGALWVVHEKSQRRIQDQAVAALESEVNAEETALEEGRNRVIELTHRLDSMKQAIVNGKFKGKVKQKAVADYNALVAQQRAERNKVNALADQYNAQVAKLRALQ